MIAEALQARQAQNVLLMDLRGISDVADFFFLSSATSDMHARSLSVEVVDQLKDAGHRPWHVEGMEQRRWILIDLVDIVVHIFRDDAREFYALERLWGDAPYMSILESADSVQSPV